MLLLLLGTTDAYCCTEPYDYAWRWRCNVYRAYDPGSGLKSDIENPEVKQNCESYRALTSPDINWEHIYTVVYRYSLEDMQGLLTRHTDNQFARYIIEHNDKELADYLLLAKRCEVIRLGMLDPWHYPPNEDSELEEVLSQALDYRGTRLVDRYLLQAVRALMSLKRYGDITALWQASDAQVPVGVIRNMILGYVGGAAVHEGRTGLAKRSFLECRDYLSLGKVCGKEYRNHLDIVAREFPDNARVPAILQEEVKGFVNIPERTSPWPVHGKAVNTEAIDSYLNVCLTGAQNAAKKGPWYYSAAYLADLKGNGTQALSLIRKAAQAKNPGYLSDSVRALEIYLEAKYSELTDQYRRRLLSGLKWLESKEGKYWECIWHLTLYNLSDRIGKTEPELALRCRNAADNYPEPTPYTYGCQYFLGLDSYALTGVIAYSRSLGKSKNALDSYLDSRGLVDLDYVHEVIGTRFLRLRNYSSAVTWLSKVSAGYEKRTNLYLGGYFCIRPFDYEHRLKKKSIPNYKLSFAQAMAELERKMKSSSPNDAGEAKVQYGIGLGNSFDACWALTQYHWNHDDAWLKSRDRENALNAARHYIQSGLNTIWDRELAAKAYISLGRRREAIRRYPETREVQMLRERCDCLRDYYRPED